MQESQVTVPNVKEIPFVTLLLVFTTIACGIAQSFDTNGRIADVLGFHLNDLQLFTNPDIAQIGSTAIRSLTYVFPHGGWWHWVPNTTALFVFGVMVEQKLGSRALLLLYFISGVIGLICHTFVPPLPTEPVAGASLAISGLLGVYCALSIREKSHWAKSRYAVIPLEVLAFALIAAWTIAREGPLQRDRETSILYHLLPLAVMWLLTCGYLHFSTVVTRPANEAVNPSGGSGEL